MNFETRDDMDEDGPVPNDLQQSSDGLLLDDIDDTTEEDIDYASSPEPGIRLLSSKRVQSPKDCRPHPLERASRKVPVPDHMHDAPPGCIPSGPSPPPLAQNANPEDELDLRLKEAAQFFASAFPVAPDDNDGTASSASFHHSDSDSVQALKENSSTAPATGPVLPPVVAPSESLPGVPDAAEAKPPSNKVVGAATSPSGPTGHGQGPGTGTAQLSFQPSDKDGARSGGGGAGVRNRASGGVEADRGRPRERDSDSGAKPTWLGHVTRKGGTEWLDQDPGQGSAQHHHHRRSDVQSATPELGVHGRDSVVGGVTSGKDSEPSSPSRRHPAAAFGANGTAPPSGSFSTSPTNQGVLMPPAGGNNAGNNANNAQQRKWKPGDLDNLDGPQKVVERVDRRERGVPVSDQGGPLPSPRGTVWPSSLRSGQPDDQLQEFAATIFAVKQPHAVRS